MNASSDSRWRLYFPFVALILTVLVYWPGLYGPYVYDDAWNLAPVEAWARGDLAWQSVLMPNRESLLASRPVGMATFALNAWLIGPTPFAFKLGNLVLHLLVGGIGGALLARLLRMDPLHSGHSATLGVTAACIWVLHPLHASTVLYIVQRMAQLSTLFTLLAVHSFVTGRQRLDSGHFNSALAWLYAVFPICVISGVLAKQNAAVAPLVCLVIEISYFKRRRLHAVALSTFYGVFIILPAVILTALFVHTPRLLLRGYEDLDFSLAERLLTQPRVLLDYVGMWVLPRTPQMGIYTDDYLLSRSLTDPGSTLPAILALSGAIAAAVLVRKHSRTIFAGVFFFLAAHAVESTFLPLDNYFEHRNYLPSFGLLLGMIGLIRFATQRVTLALILPQHAKVLLALLITVLAFATLGRSLVWKDSARMVEQGLRHHPQSLRAHLDAASAALRSKQYDSAASVLAALTTDVDPRKRFVAQMSSNLIACASGRSVPRDLLLATAAKAPSTLTSSELYVVEMIDDISVKRLCPQLAPNDLGDALDTILARSSRQSELSVSRSVTRNIAAQVYARAGNWEAARHHALIGWNATHRLSVGTVLAFVHVQRGDNRAAARLLSVLDSMVPAYDIASRERLAMIRALLQRS